MPSHLLTSEQFVPRPRDEVFAFFAKPENLGAITPPWLDFRVLTPSPVPMERGALIDYVIRLGPLPTRWRTLITRHDPPHGFVDEQLQGPYSFWHHTHTFAEVEGGTLIGDRVLYVLPFGALGRLVERLVIRRQLRAIFAHRRRAIAERFGG
jgi:ligand-binding SRPBCC domain-containing protein